MAPRSVRGAAARSLVIGSSMVPAEDGGTAAQVAWVPERVDPTDISLLEAPLKRPGFIRLLVVMSTSAGVSADCRKAVLGLAPTRTEFAVEATMRDERKELEEVAERHAGVTSASMLAEPGALGGAGRASFSQPGHLLVWVIVPNSGLSASHVIDAAASARDAWCNVPAKQEGSGFTDLPEDDEADEVEDGPSADDDESAAAESKEAEATSTRRKHLSRRPRPSVMLPCQILCPLTSRELQAASDAMQNIRPANRAVLLPRDELLNAHGIGDLDSVEIVCAPRGKPSYEYEPARADVAARRLEAQRAAEQAEAMSREQQAETRSGGRGAGASHYSGDESKSADEASPGMGTGSREGQSSKVTKELDAAGRALLQELQREEA